jgi:hypothetical protein
MTIGTDWNCQVMPGALAHALAGADVMNLGSAGLRHVEQVAEQAAHLS